MPLFSTRRTRATRTSGLGTTSRSTKSRGRSLSSFFRRKNPNRVAGGHKSILSNPNSTHNGRKKAKRQLRFMGRGRETHVPFMTRVKRTLGIRSTPRRTTARTRW